MVKPSSSFMEELGGYFVVFISKLRKWIGSRSFFTLWEQAEELGLFRLYDVMWVI